MKKRQDNELFLSRISKGRASDVGLLMLDSGRPSMEPNGRYSFEPMRLSHGPEFEERKSNNSRLTDLYEP